MNSENLFHILVSILSLLDLEEAVKTSILSRRWVKLWTYTRSLFFSRYFDDPILGRSRFINWVNNTLKLHQGTTLDDLIVCFDLDIDSWIIFALDKRAQCLHLDFTMRPFVRSMSGGYTLTIQLLSRCAINNYLNSLTLIALDVSGEVVKYILSACPLLQLLKVETSNSLVRLRVSGPSLNLNTLEIIDCPLEYIEISATSLVSFSYDGSTPKGTINNVPSLVEVSIAGDCADFLVENNHQFSGFTTRDTCTPLQDEGLTGFVSFPYFPNMENLKHVELRLHAYLGESLLSCTDLLDAASLLRRLTLMVSWTSDCPWKSSLACYDVTRDRNSTVKELKKLGPVHEHLKVIEFTSFKGGAVEVKLLRCLLGRAVSLKRLIIGPCSNNFGMLTLCKEAGIIAKQLETRLPPGAELVIL